jgi:hypothetical protein
VAVSAQWKKHEPSHNCGGRRMTRDAIQRLSWIGAACLAVVMAILSLWPLTTWQLPQKIPNGAERMETGGLRFAAPGIARAEAPVWLDAIVEQPDQTLAISLRVKVYSGSQRGPARIFTVSEDTLSRNLTLGQDGSDLVLRLRSQATDANGMIDGKPLVRVPRIFEVGRWHQIDLTISPKELRVERDGILIADQELPGSPFATWDRSFDLALGNELTNNRPWLGEIASAHVRVGDTTVDYLAPGTLSLPDHHWQFASRPRLALTDPSVLFDAVVNVLFYIPLGLLLGVAFPDKAVRWAIVICGFSLLMEGLQLGIPDRTATVIDVLTNTLGGVVGLLLARGLWSWLKAKTSA